MSCLIAHVLDEAGLGENGLADSISEGRLVNVGAEIVLVGLLKRFVVGVQPRHTELQGSARIDAGDPRVAIDRAFRLADILIQEGPLGLKEGEVTQLQFSPKRLILKSKKQCVMFHESSSL